MEDAKPTPNNTLWTLAETAILCGLGLLAIFWLIPTETTAGGIGLNPSTLPTVCMAAIIVLVALDAALRTMRPVPTAVLPSAAPALKIIAVCVIGGVLLQFMNPAICSLLLLPPLMIMLGDRSPVRISVTTVATAAILAAALAWRG